MHRQFHQLVPRRHLVASFHPVAVLHVVVQLFTLLQVHGVVVLEVRNAAEVGVLQTATIDVMLFYTGPYCSYRAVLRVQRPPTPEIMTKIS